VECRRQIEVDKHVKTVGIKANNQVKATDIPDGVSSNSAQHKPLGIISKS
jgi:hypothetical protein